MTAAWPTTVICGMCHGEGRRAAVEVVALFGRPPARVAKIVQCEECCGTGVVLDLEPDPGEPQQLALAPAPLAADLGNPTDEEIEAAINALPDSFAKRLLRELWTRYSALERRVRENL